MSKYLEYLSLKDLQSILHSVAKESPELVNRIDDLAKKKISAVDEDDECQNINEKECIREMKQLIGE